MQTKLQLLPCAHEFVPDWRPGTPGVALAHPRLGAILHAVVLEGTHVLYDLPVWSEPPGAITVPVLDDGRLVFVEVWRPVMAFRDDQNSGFLKPDMANRGRWSLELPRGFPEPGEAPASVAVREAEEETGLSVVRVTQIGQCNPNTSFNLNHLPIFRVDLSPVPSTLTPDRNEQIRTIVSLTWSETLDAVQTGRISCGITQAALMAFMANEHVASLSQPDV